MQIPGHATTTVKGTPTVSLGPDMSSVITSLASPKDAKVLPRGSIVGDLHGGLTFSDAVAAALEKRSNLGWQEFEPAPGAPHWTLIVLDR